MKSILVIGATSSIAQSVTRLMAADGARLFLVARDPNHLDSVADDLRVRGGTVETLMLDLTDRERHEAMLDAAQAFLGTMDAVLIAHGTLPHQKECERDPATALSVYETNCLSVIALLTSIANRMEKTGKGCIAVISSVAGDRGRKSNYVYGSSKAAVNVFLQGLRSRLNESDVSVVTIKPGLVETPMTAHLEKNAFFAKPETVGKEIYRAMKRRSDVVYSPWLWRPIMFAIRAIPERLFKRFNL